MDNWFRFFHSFWLAHLYSSNVLCFFTFDTSVNNIEYEQNLLLNFLWLYKTFFLIHSPLYFYIYLSELSLSVKIIYRNFTSFNQILYKVIVIKCLVDIEKTLLQLNESCYSLQWNFILLLCKWFFLVALYFWDRIFFVRDHRILFAIMRILTSNYFILDSLARTSPLLEIL